MSHLELVDALAGCRVQELLDLYVERGEETLDEASLSPSFRTTFPSPTADSR